jgi:hypothetical protein
LTKFGFLNLKEGFKFKAHFERLMRKRERHGGFFELDNKPYDSFAPIEFAIYQLAAVFVFRRGRRGVILRSTRLAKCSRIIPAAPDFFGGFFKARFELFRLRRDFPFPSGFGLSRELEPF